MKTRVTKQDRLDARISPFSFLSGLTLSDRLKMLESDVNININIYIIFFQIILLILIL